MISETDIEIWKSWIGRTETGADTISAGPVARLAAALNREQGALRAGCEVPPLSHWLFFLPSAPQREIGPDGHPRRGGFLPPVTLPRRMWAGSQITFHRPLCVGQEVTRVSTITDVQGKQGRSGPLVFVQVRHVVTDALGPIVTETQDIVYREADRNNGAEPKAAPSNPQSVPRKADWWQRVEPDGVLLFRFSALTFNGHRIHYDRLYAQNEEGYPGLVVHGPLQAMLLMESFMREHPTSKVKSFGFTSRRPLFDAPFDVCGAQESAAETKLWIEDQIGQTVMEATLNVE
jgi:3-methylfumaryl-CoA hydratase